MKNDFIKNFYCLWKHPVNLISSFIGILIIYNVIEVIYVDKYKMGHASILSSIIDLIFLAALAFLLLYYVVKYQKRHIIIRHPHNTGVKLTETIISIIVMVLLPGFINNLIMASAGINPAHTSLSENQKEINQMLGGSLPNLIWIIVMSVLIGPIIEEILFRFILIGPRKIRGAKLSNKVRWIRIIVSVTLFAGLHLLNQILNMDWLNYNDFVILIANSASYLTVSIILTWRYVHTDNICSSLSTHIGSNICTTIIQFSII